jgi:hypothetical protein
MVATERAAMGRLDCQEMVAGYMFSRCHPVIVAASKESYIDAAWSTGYSALIRTVSNCLSVCLQPVRLSFSIDVIG